MIRTAAVFRAFVAIAACGSFTFGLVGAETPAAAQSATGAALNVSPLRIEIQDAQRGATLLIANVSTRAVPVQTRLFAWSQVNGEDVYAPSTDLTISPSIVSIPAGETQIVRLLRTTPASPGEKRFRLVVDQLPDPTLAQAGTAEARIRFNLPVFLDRDTAAPAELGWTIGPNGISVTNSGGQTARIIKIDVKTADGKSVALGHNILRYVQGKSTISWPDDNACSLGAVTITAYVDGRTVDAQPRSSCG
ncbi:molecular chaperone [Tsuneonella mangrovi]|uniref:fimbrial biogenesis chaperone n=1 Tax=Tsuneonella mangrovi TaxID=1982042 RepID=UPI000BA1E518|nr:fimbria/pilus periplasmic chaperone [Tsuneonella mangrovi]